MYPVIWTFLGAFLIQGCLAARATWSLVPNRKFADGFEPLSGNATLHAQTEKLAVDQVLDSQAGSSNRDKPPMTSEFSANRVIGAAASGGEGFASLVRDGADLKDKLDIDPEGFNLLIDNRCTAGNVKLRCLSATKDTGYFSVNSKDGYALQMSTVHVVNSQVAERVRWVCEFRKDNTRIIMDVYGGTAPRHKFNLYEIRDDGAVRLTSGSAAVYKKQPKGEWKDK